MINELKDKNSPNGRVDILGPIGPQFEFSDKIPLKECTFYSSALRGSWEETPLSFLFFSEENIKLLQNSIKEGVYKLSNQQFVIATQSCDELKIIMRSIYLQNSHNLPYDLKIQIKNLNEMVLKYAIKQVYNAAVGYIKYKYDVSNPPSIMEHAINSSSRNYTLELNPFF